MEGKMIKCVWSNRGKDTRRNSGGVGTKGAESRRAKRNKAMMDWKSESKKEEKRRY